MKMSLKKAKKILKKHKKDISFLVGNGIHRHRAIENKTSWIDLLNSLYAEATCDKEKPITEGVSLTEFYDVIEIKSKQNNKALDLQKKFCQSMSSWSTMPHHQKFIDYAVINNSPVLTTNFDPVLSNINNLTFYKLKKKHFTDFYPWECYYANDELSEPENGFGIWHINGLVHYSRSIRLGLAHYMGSVARARKLIYRSDKSGLFKGEDQFQWAGHLTWLHIIFNKSLFMFGIGLEENETFLRWLIIERAKYFNKFPNRKKSAWYIYKEVMPLGKKLFLETMGIDCIKLDTYDEIYESLWT
jgi:hypothetical protein